MADKDGLSSDYLAKLLLLQGMSTLLPDKKLNDVIINGLKDFPGIKNVSWESQPNLIANKNIVQLPLKYGDSDFGCLQLLTYNPKKLHPYIPYLQNFSALIAVVLETKRKEKNATTLQERFFELSPDLFCVANSKGYFTKLSLSWEKTLGWSREELYATPFQNFVHPDDIDPTFSTLKTLINGKKVFGFVNRYQHKDGRYRWLEWVSYTEGDAIFATARDITETRIIAKELKLAASVYNNTNEAIFVFNQSGEILSVNHAFTQITGFSFQKAVGSNINILSQEVTHKPNLFKSLLSELENDNSWEGESWCHRQYQDSFLTHCSVTLVQDDNVPNKHRFVCVMHDITEQKEDQERIHQLAYHDPLTGLANRTLLQDRLTHSISLTERHQHQMALLFIDLDNFKSINDSLGHDIGDNVLKAQAHRLVSCVRKSDTVSRMGGDEFVIFIDSFQHSNDITSLAKKIIKKIGQPIEGNHPPLQITSSIGIAIFPDDGRDRVTLMKNADTAMYTAKSAGKNTFCYFSPAMMAKADQRLKLELALREAIKENQFEMYYQPRICLANKEAAGGEALIRWHHPEKGLLTPKEFIPYAEEAGLINEIGSLVISTVIKQIAQWQKTLAKAVPISINISALQFNQGTVKDVILQYCDKYNVATSLIEMEVTESVIMKNPDQASATLQSLKNIGIRIAIDDFGTGHSSLAYLKKMPLDTLKIDQSFIKDLQNNPDDAAIVKIIISLAKALNLELIAEGVELLAHEEMLDSFNCLYAQGFYYAKPMPAKQFADFIIEHASLIPENKNSSL